MSLWETCYRIVSAEPNQRFYYTYTYRHLAQVIRTHLTTLSHPEPKLGTISLSSRWIPDSIPVLIACLLLNHPLRITLSEQALRRPTLALVDESSHRSPPLLELSIPELTKPWLYIGGACLSTSQLDRLLHSLRKLPKLTDIVSDSTRPLGFAPTREINIVEILLLLQAFQQGRELDVIPNTNDKVVGIYSASDQPDPIVTSATVIPLFCEQSRNRWDSSLVPQQGIYLVGNRIQRYQPRPVRVVLTRSRPELVPLQTLAQYYQVRSRDYLREDLIDLPLRQLGSRLTQLLLFSKHYPLFLYQIAENHHHLQRVDDTEFRKSWIEIIWTDTKTDTEIQRSRRTREIETRLLADRRTSKVFVVADREQDRFSLHVYYLTVLGQHFPVLTTEPPKPKVVYCQRRQRETHRIAPQVSLCQENSNTVAFSGPVVGHTLWHLLRSIRPTSTKVNPVQVVLPQPISEILPLLSQRLHTPLLVFTPAESPRVVSSGWLTDRIGNSDTMSAYAYLATILAHRFLGSSGNLSPSATELPLRIHLVHVTVLSHPKESDLKCQVYPLDNPGNYLTVFPTGTQTCQISGYLEPTLFQRLDERMD